ncbi:hypothetical protein INS49_003891 [Diaporthe citri]|uniref:uncharacterized protein n=1 Tax=Diaporthe citri TaxID=83186 RepID=UPI001C7FD156|nr:uncharacterized protein INS49_003891 [Diaporthe citri]KAG6354810.1 hypothetical protein INS49_003891 [Diaporthe citri]
MSIDKDFREAMSYILSKFFVSRGQTREVVPLHRSATDDAPASAISEEYLQGLDSRVFFRTILGEERKFTVERIGLPQTLHSGYYTTTGESGQPLTIVYPTCAPSNIATDPLFEREIQIIRSFVARWERGEKSCFGQDPFSDIPSIQMIICIGRWHRTMTHSINPFRAVMSLNITNEALWKRGLFYRSIHIGTKDDEITSEYDWWSYGRTEADGSRWVEVNLEPVHTPTSRVHLAFARGLIRATFRNVTQPVRRLLAADVKTGNKKAQGRYMRYCADGVRQAIQKYGMDSEQHRLLEVKPDVLETTEGRKVLVAKDWAPSWETMMRLDQEQQKVGPLPPRGLPPTLRRRRLLRLDQHQQKVGPLQPLGLPSTLRRQRPLRRRSPPTLALVVRQPWTSSFRMKKILPPDITPGKGAVGSGPKNRPESPESRRPGAQKYGMRSIFSPHSPHREAVKNPMMERHAKRRQPKTSRPWPSKKEMKNILSNDIDPEEADISSSTKGRMKRLRLTPRATRQRGPFAPGMTPETKAASSEAEERGARPVSRAHRNQKKYAPSRSIWW